MNEYFHLIIFILITVILALLLKICLLKKSAKEIGVQIKEKTEEETNTLIEISSADKDMRSLAVSLNENLKEINTLRHKYSQGDEEIKRAVTNISHDLRTPLTAISGYLDLLKKEEKSEQAKQYLDIIGNRTNAMKSLTEEMFRFSVVTTSGTELNLAEINVCSVIEESVAANYTLLNTNGITPEISLPQKLIRITDKNLLVRVFSNIISNAAKYSDGDLFISADENGTVKFSNTAENLSNIQAARLFDRFYTVNDAVNSTGLGLSIAKEIINKLGGEIYSEYENKILTIIIKI